MKEPRTYEFAGFIKDTLDGLARASGVRWYGHVLRRALDFEVAGRGRGRPNMTWKRQMEEHTAQIGLKRGFH